jgi:hypothetical protein
LSEDIYRTRREKSTILIPFWVTKSAKMDTPSSGTMTPVDLESAGYDGSIRKRLTVTFRDLNVRVTAPDAALGSTLWSEIDPRQLRDLFKRTQKHKRVRDHSMVRVWA